MMVFTPWLAVTTLYTLACFLANWSPGWAVVAVGLTFLMLLVAVFNLSRDAKDVVEDFQVLVRHPMLISLVPLALAVQVLCLASAGYWKLAWFRVLVSAIDAAAVTLSRGKLGRYDRISA